MKLDELKKHTDALRGASRFRHGDPLTFSIPLLPLEVELPGPSDPDDYLGRLLAKTKYDIEGKRVLIVGAGNGGLAATAMNLGAKEVVAAEGRDRYHGALDEVIRLVAGLHEFNPLTYRSWPSTGVEKSLGRFDLILFPESLEECREPIETLTSIMRLLKADGVLFVEVQHGAQSVLKDPVNSFRPKPEAFEVMMQQIAGTEPTMKLPGRAQNRMIYTFGRQSRLGRPVTAPPAPLPVMPREKPPVSAVPPTLASKALAAVEKAAEVKAPPPPPPPAKGKEPDPRLGHMLNGPPMSDEAVARHKAFFEEGKEEPVVIVPDEPKATDKPDKTAKKKKKRKTKKSSGDEKTDPGES